MRACNTGETPRKTPACNAVLTKMSRIGTIYPPPPVAHVTQRAEAAPIDVETKTKARIDKIGEAIFAQTATDRTITGEIMAKRKGF